MASCTMHRRAGLRAATSSWLQARFSREPARFASHTPAQHAVDEPPSQTGRSLQVPAPTPFVPDVATFFRLIGRGLPQHADKLSWEQLFTLTNRQARQLGIEPPNTRRYLFQWRQRFKLGDFGLGGDAKFVDAQGNIRLRLVEAPLSEEEAQRWSPNVARGSSTSTPNTVKRVLNVPGDEPLPAQEAAQEHESADTAAAEDGAEGAEPSEASHEQSNNASTHTEALPPITEEILQQAVRIQKVNYRRGRGISAPHVKLVKHCKGQLALIAPEAGLWESKRGEKLDGGERRRAERRFKQRRAARAAGRA